MEQPLFSSIQDYGMRFIDSDYWRPYVEAVCARHNLVPCQNILAGLPGTFPVFLVDDRYVVKFFGDFFDGPQCFAVELDCYAMLDTSSHIPTPKLLAHGYLFPSAAAWQWPYLISTLVPGTSLGAVKDRVAYDDKESIVQTLGLFARHLHTLPLSQTHALSPSWERFLAFLHERRLACVADHARWGVLPFHLISQIDAYLPPIAALVDQQTVPHLLHCDLNEDHVLGDFVGERWQLTGIIDFGDAMVGDRIYEFVALHIGLMHCDKRLLRVFLDSYGFDQGLRERFTLRAMSYTLLHEFAVLRQVFAEFPTTQTIKSLEELAVVLWDPEQPGFD